MLYQRSRSGRVAVFVILTLKLAVRSWRRPTRRGGFLGGHSRTLTELLMQLLMVGVRGEMFDQRLNMLKETRLHRC